MVKYYRKKDMLDFTKMAYEYYHQTLKKTVTPIDTYQFQFDIRVSGRACGRCAPTRKLWEHAGAENQNEKGLCDSGYFPLGRSPLFARYDFLKKDV